MDRQNSAAAVVWLKVTDYMQGWLLKEFGGEARIGDRKVVCMQHLEGIKRAMKMIAEKDQRLPGQPPIVMSAQLHNCISAGLELDNCALMQEYALTKETFEMYIPLEMPALRVTLDGAYNVAACMEPSFFGGVAATISGTPAAAAIPAVCSTVDTSGAVPPGI